MKPLLYIAFVLFINSCSAQKNCQADAKIISWTAATKNRVTEEKMSEVEYTYSNKNINADSLTYYFLKLTPSNDTLYNIRLYCRVSKHEKIKEIYVDKNGVIKVNDTLYSKSPNFVHFLLRSVVTDNKKEYFPPW